MSVAPIVSSVTVPSISRSTASPMVAVDVRKCLQLAIPCPEDVTIDHLYGRVYISSCSRPRMLRSGYLSDSGWRAGTLDLPNLLAQPSAGLVNGAILTLELAELDSPPLNRTDGIEELGAFRPIGIDFFPINPNEARLFATDRPRDGRARVVIFDVDRKSGTLSSPRFVEDERFIRAPNEIAAINADAFYLTNSQGGRFAWQQMLETFFPVGFGSIVHCRLATDGPVFYVEKAFQNYPNGVAYDRTTKRLYVAAPPAKKVIIYAIVDDPAAPRLIQLDEINVPVAADNITWDSAGNLWVAGSPDLMAAIIYMAGDRETCPSEVVRIVDPSGIARVEPMFSDSGNLISSCSVGAYYEAGDRRQLVIGAPFQDRLLVIDL